VNDKELAITVAEKWGDEIFEITDEEICLRLLLGSIKFKVSKYIHDKAAEILFSEGMAGKIDDYFMRKEPFGGIECGQ